MTRTLVLATAAVGLATTLAGAQELPPERRGRLLAWLRAGTYRQSYLPEPEGVHPSTTGAHPDVLTWYGPILVEDLRAGRTPFRKGASMVKELYDRDGRLVGHAVMRKVARRSRRSGVGWFFYEGFEGGPQFARGRGAPICVSCHRAGTDFLLSPFRP